jgi:hypothetical protein
MCRIERLARYDKAPKFELMIHSWDIGATLEGNASVCTTWGVAKAPDGRDNIYLTRVGYRHVYETGTDKTSNEMPLRAANSEARDCGRLMASRALRTLPR